MPNLFQRVTSRQLATKDLQAAVEPKELTWAMEAKPAGQAVGVAGPIGSMVGPQSN